jgi:phytoene desaturase
MLLAAAGCDVTVLERGSRAGGRTSTIEQDGFKFDRGPTFFLFPEVLRSIFRMCGRELRDEVELVRLDPNYRLVFEDGGRIDASSNLEKLKQEIARISPADAEQLDAYMRDNRRKFGAFKPILESPFQSHLDVLRLPLRELAQLARPWSSVDQDLRRFFADPKIRLALSFQSKYLGMSPFKCPSLFTILAFLEYEFGVFHPMGGCAAVSDAMYRVARDMGVEFRFDEPVQEILFAGKRARGVRTAQREYRADALVVNADFAGAMRDLVPDHLRSNWTNKKIERKKMSCSTFMMYLGVEGRYDDLAHHTIFLSRNYEDNLKDIDTRHRLTDDPSVYVHNPSLIDPGLAPRGMSSLYVLAPVSHEHPNIDWAMSRGAFRERVLDQLAKLGLDDIRERIRTEIVCTPADWASDLNLYKGATFSLAHSLDQMLSLRPRNRFEDLEGVYLVGGGTHPGSGLPVIYQSAKISTQLLAEDFGLKDAWQPHEEPRAAAWPVLAGEGA